MAASQQKLKTSYNLWHISIFLLLAMSLPWSVLSMADIKVRLSLCMGRYKIYCTILYYTILYYTILYYTILYYTILYYTILYYTILYYTTLD